MKKTLNLLFLTFTNTDTNTCFDARNIGNRSDIIDVTLYLDDLEKNGISESTIAEIKGFDSPFKTEAENPWLETEAKYFDNLTIGNLTLNIVSKETIISF